MRTIDADALSELVEEPIEIFLSRLDLKCPPIIETEPHWIPVTERLPKDGRQVLVYAMSVHYALAKYDEMRDADGTYKKQWVTFDAWKPTLWLHI